MKNWKLKFGALIALCALPFLAQAQIPYGTSGGSVTTGVSVVGTAGTTETLPTTSDTLAGLATTQTFTGVDGFSGGIATQAQAFSSVGPGRNPLALISYSAIPVASITTSQYTFISGIPGRTIYPSAPTITVAGTAATATGVIIKCTSGNVLASIPIAALVTLEPIIGTWSTVNGAAVVGGTAYASGCASGDGVLVSVNGSGLTGTTTFYVNMPYTVQ